MTRYRAASIHLAISAAISIPVFLGVYRVWFPGALFDGAGGRDLLRILVAVGVTIGPLLTLIVFRSGKRGMRFDLAVIGILQSLAFAYGIWAFAETRPAYIAFVKDRFELARANEIPDDALLEAGMHRYRDLPWTGPRIVGVRFPQDPDEKFKLMISGMAGTDIQCWPKYHVPYDTEREAVRAQAQPLVNLLKYNPGLTLQSIAAERGVDPARVGFLPMRAGKIDLTVFVDQQTGEIVDIARYKPWAYE